MNDVATYCRWKFVLEAFMRIPLGLLLLFVALYIAPQMTAEDIGNGHASWGVVYVGVLPFFIGFLIFSSGTRRIHAAVLKNCWFKGGADGISFRLPYKARRQTLFLTYKIAGLTLPWKDVQKIHPLQYRVKASRSDGRSSSRRARAGLISAVTSRNRPMPSSRPSKTPGAHDETAHRR